MNVPHPDMENLIASKLAELRDAGTGTVEVRMSEDVSNPDWQPIRSYDLTDESEQLKLAQKLYARYLADRASDDHPLYDKAATRLIAGIQISIDHARHCGGG